MGMYCQLALQYLLEAIRESAHLPGCRSFKNLFFLFFFWSIAACRLEWMRTRRMG